MPEVTLETLIERVDSGFKRVDERFDTNDRAHDGIIERQDTTNGNVTQLQRWYYQILGAGFVVGIIIALLGIFHENISIHF